MSVYTRATGTGCSRTRAVSLKFSTCIPTRPIPNALWRGTPALVQVRLRECLVQLCDVEVDRGHADQLCLIGTTPDRSREGKIRQACACVKVYRVEDNVSSWAQQGCRRFGRVPLRALVPRAAYRVVVFALDVLVVRVGLGLRDRTR